MDCRIKDLTGKRFGRLVVVKDSGIRKRANVVWSCKCDCGNLVLIRSQSLICGDTQSCGCLHSEITIKVHAVDISGEKFGRLTAIKLNHKVGNRTFWLFKCDCGKEIIVQKGSVTGGYQKSCGCLHSEVAKELMLKTNKDINWVEGTHLKNLKAKQFKNNKSGIKGVFWDAWHEKWLAKIQFQGKQIFIGRFNKLEDAAKARKEAEEKYFAPILKKYGRLEEK